MTQNLGVGPAQKSENAGFTTQQSIEAARPNFLKPEHIKDMNGKRPGEEGYDETTLHIPQQCWACFTPAMKQYW